MTAARARAAYRYVLHRITEHPDTNVTYEAECLWCDWAAEPRQTPRVPTWSA
ncbi:DUF7848 domain-containing protein [Streptomyces sp. NBC_01320]|uniref:DUF7848 domain-containing protein n=1 Tax=Streptomyces sp. NBC_01320 TaxID=2903824 RepID=UPI002E0EC89C|nr:hypothetical protein OG395_32820 [Streptomyces sp. NBC_01320]